MAVGFVVVFGTFLATSAWNYALGSMDSSIAGVFLYVQPVVAALAEQAAATATTFANGPADEDALVPPLNNVAQYEKVLGAYIPRSSSPTPGA